MVVPIEGEGTPDSAWRTWAGLAELAVFALHPAPSHVVVVAPHPDDEVLGVGGTLALLHAAGATVVVVAATDGEVSHPASPTTTADELARIRRLEQHDALRRLGLGNVSVHRCALPDGRLAGHEPDLAHVLGELLRPDSWCLTTWAHDGHPDHEAAGRAAAVATARTGARLVSFPIWTWHWARPADARVPWERARRIPLPPAVARAKRRAAAAFTSQLEPLSEQPGDEAILGQQTIARLTRDDEVVLL